MRTFASNLRFGSMRALCIAATIAVAATTVVAQSAPPASYAITHAKIFTLAGTPIEDGTVLIKDGKITAIGEELSIPSDAKVIDAKGLQVYPGLFDPITQMGLSEIGAVRATVDTTETGSFNPDVVAATAVSPSSTHIPVTRAAGITEVLAVPASGGFDTSGAGNMIGGQASAFYMAGWTMEDMVIRRNTAMVIGWPSVETRSFDFATFSAKEKPYTDAKKEYDKQVEELADWFEQARHYAQSVGKTTDPTFERDVKLESMGPVVRGDMPVLIFADRARSIRDAVEFCQKQKLRMILAGGTEAWKVKELLRAREIPVILRPTLGEPADEDDAYDRLLSQPAELQAAGIKIAFGSFDNSFARRLGQQAANSIAHGLSYEDGLKAVTLYPAQMFGLDSQIGTIETGKSASLLVTNGDPLELTTEIKYLFVKGQLVSLDNRQKDLYQKFAGRPKAAR